MTNEEKAREIAKKAPFLSNVTPDIQAHAYNAALEMAGWQVHIRMIAGMTLIGMITLLMLAAN